MIRPQQSAMHIQGSVDTQGNQVDPTQQRPIVYSQNQPINVQQFNPGNSGGIQNVMAISSNQTNVVNYLGSFLNLLHNFSDFVYLALMEFSTQPSSTSTEYILIFHS